LNHKDSLAVRKLHGGDTNLIESVVNMNESHGVFSSSSEQSHRIRWVYWKVIYSATFYTMLLFSGKITEFCFGHNSDTFAYSRL
jgi:hypothetical protein